jgi:hypothetical protein
MVTCTAIILDFVSNCFRHQFFLKKIMFCNITKSTKIIENSEEKCYFKYAVETWPNLLINDRI